MEAKKKRLTLLLEPDAQRRLQDAAARQGVSVPVFCRTAIEAALDNTAAAQNGSADWWRAVLDESALLQKEILGDHVLPGDSTDIIREAREERTRQLESLAWRDS